MKAPLKVELLTGVPPRFPLLGNYNRRFMFCPGTGELILGTDNIRSSTHGDEHYQSRAVGDYRDFIRGWVGCGRGYAAAIIHFAPGFRESSFAGDPKLFADFVATLRMFVGCGATSETILRGAGASRWELPFGQAYPELLSAPPAVSRSRKRAQPIESNLAAAA